MVHFFKTNIHCVNCIKAVRGFLSEVPSVENWDVDTDNQQKILKVSGDSVDKEEVINAVREAGFDIDWIKMED